ncbi:MAG TPA: SAM-dependent methyltransferase, partial [Eubacteriales bacterium]|nr:SAM-dependent methyltransferase [Eubacteriales bacterium]
YVNAILNKIAKREFNLPKEDDKLYLSVKYNKPEWFIEAVKKEYSSADAEKIFCAKPPSGVHIRINGRLYNGQAFERALTENGESFVKSPAGGYFAEISKTVREMFRLGLITYQGVSSMLAVQALSIEQSDDVLDACAAPGGKSVYASELASLGSVTACDVHEHRLDLIKSYAARMRADNVSVEKRDATEFHDDYFEAFDKVLVDAPCSGLGTAPEKPDVLINKTAESIKELPELQLAILKNTAKYLKKGGALVYSTCTLLKAENREVVARFLSEDVGFILEKMDIPIDNAGEVQILPQEGADGFFIAKLRKI